MKQILNLLTITLTFFVYCSSYADEAGTMPLRTVEIEQVKKSNISQTAQLIGTVRAKHNVLLIAKASGTLDHIAHAGDRLEKDAPIATINNRNLARDYQLAKENEQLAEKQHKRMQTMLQSKIVSKTEAEKQEQLWLEAKQKRLNAKKALDDTSIKAPFTGVVGVYKYYDGAKVELNAPIVYFYDPSNLIVEFDIPLGILKQLKNTTTAIVNNKRYQVPYIQRMIDPATQMAPAYLDYHCDTCVIGSTTQLNLILMEKHHVMVIPYHAVFMRAGKTFVYRLKDNKVLLSPVTLGIREKNNVEITDGLNPGDQIIVYGHERLYPGETVQLHQTNNASTKLVP